MKKLFFLSLILSSSLLIANDSPQTIGLAGNYIHTFYKAKSELKPLPLVNLNYGNLYIRGSKLGYNLYTEKDFSFSVLVNPVAGYFDGWAIKHSDMDNGINIKTRKMQFMSGVAMNYNLSESVFGNANYIFGKHGSKGEINLTKVYIVNDYINILPSISFKYFDKNFVNYYVSVSKDELNNSPILKNIYKGKNSVGGGANITVEILLTEQLTTNLFCGIDYIDHNISNSPIIKSNNQIFGGVGFRYSF